MEQRLTWSCALLLLLSLLGSSEHSSRVRRDVTAQQPRMLSEGGSLIFQTAENHNITFRSAGTGAILVNDEDLTRTVFTVKHPTYSNRDSRDVAYAVLLEIMRKDCKESTVETVKQKIQSIRAAYRRERNKVTASKKSGAGTEDVYKPKLWYYHQLEFLFDADECRPSVSNLQEEDFGENEPESISQDSTESDLPSTSHKKRKKSGDGDDFLSQTKKLVEILSEPSTVEDATDGFCKHIGEKLRSLSTDQRMVADNLISTIVFKGQMGILTPYTSIVDGGSSATAYPTYSQL